MQDIMQQYTQFMSLAYMVAIILIETIDTLVAIVDFVGFFVHTGENSYTFGITRHIC